MLCVWCKEGGGGCLVVAMWLDHIIIANQLDLQQEGLFLM
jgi:hypothetical protein